MKNMFTTSPDDGCHEIKPGIFCRPVHPRDYKKLQASGWVFNSSDLMGEEDSNLDAEYIARFGKKPHHKMLPETIQKAIEDYDQAKASESDSNAAGD